MLYDSDMNYLLVVDIIGAHGLQAYSIMVLVMDLYEWNNVSFFAHNELESAL